LDSVIFLVLRLLSLSRLLIASNLFLSLIFHLGNLFLIFHLHFSRPLLSTLFPYTTLFRSALAQAGGVLGRIAFGVRRRPPNVRRSEEHTSELQSPDQLVCRLLLEKKKESHFESRQSLSDCPFAF